MSNQEVGGCMETTSEVQTREGPQATVVDGTDCATRTFLTRSAHSSVQWTLPSAKASSYMTVKAGAHNRYVFPACNRVFWSDLKFTCQATGNSAMPYQWRLVSGTFDSDAYCTGSPGSNFYQSISDKGYADK